MHTEHVHNELMDYVTGRLLPKERTRVEEHLRQCSRCQVEYVNIQAAEAVLHQSHRIEPPAVYYSTILPRVRKRLVSQQHSFWNYGKGIAKIALPLAVSAALVILLIRTPQNALGDSSQTEGLRRAMTGMNEEEIVQAVEREYTAVPITPSHDIIAAGISEHLQGDFLKSAVSKQIDNEEAAEMDVEGMIANLNGEQLDQVLSGLSERKIL